MKRRAGAKDVMKKLLSARAFIGAAFKHGQYKVIRSPLNAGARKKRGETRQRRPEISLSRRNISTLYRRGHLRRGEGDQWLIVGAPSVTSGRSERTQTLPCIFKIIFFLLCHILLYSHQHPISVCHSRSRLEHIRHMQYLTHLQRFHTVPGTSYKFSEEAQASGLSNISSASNCDKEATRCDG